MGPAPETAPPMEQSAIFYSKSTNTGRKTRSVMNHHHNVDSHKAVDIIFNLLPHLKVLKHKPGRIILKLSFKILGMMQDTQLRRLAETIPGIRKAKTSLLSRSVDIHYDHDQLPYDLWESLLELNHRPERASRVRTRLFSIFDNSLSKSSCPIDGQVTGN
jgi:hypothetical protein